MTTAWSTWSAVGSRGCAFIGEERYCEDTHICPHRDSVTAGGNSPELVSGVAGTPFLYSFSEAAGLAAGGATDEAEEEEGLGREVLSADSSGSPSDLGDVHVHVTAGGNSLELVLGVAGTPFFHSQDEVAGGAAVGTPAGRRRSSGRA